MKCSHVLLALIMIYEYIRLILSDLAINYFSNIWFDIFASIHSLLQVYFSESLHVQSADGVWILKISRAKNIF